MDNKPPRMLTAEDVMERLSVSKSLRIQPGRVSQRHFDAIYFGDEGCDSL